MSGSWWAVGGAGLGVGLMYLMDPRSGRWRRAHAQDKAVHLAHGAGDAVEIVARDMAHRSRGLLFELLGRLRRERVEDATLEARVRSALGRVCSHPHSVRVHCTEGRVRLDGVILAAEHKKVRACVRRVRGVRGMEDRLEVHKQAGNHPDLQGGKARPGARPELLQRHWSPTARFLAVLGGGSLAAWGLSRSGPLAKVLGGAGLAVGARALTNMEFKRLFGVGAGRDAIRLHKDLHVHAPLEEVFSFWSEMQNFPRFMSHVQEVRRLDEERWHWKVSGPAGTSFQWTALVTRFAPNEVLAWKSEEGATIENAGIIRFQRQGEGTRLDIRLSYNPPAGAIGHAFARLLGVDPKRQMDDDLLRFKSLLERGKATGHETVTREQLLAARRSPEPSLH